MKCKCNIEYTEPAKQDKIIFCPLHAAAGEMLSDLKECVAGLKMYGAHTQHYEALISRAEGQSK